MKVIYSAEQLAHCPKTFLSSGALAENPEQPERAQRLLAAALDCGLQQESPEDVGDDIIASVHTSTYLEFLQNIYRRWSRIAGASKEVLPNVHPISRDDGYPKSAVGQVGYHIYDSSCPISADTWHSARWSALSAAHAARWVMGGSDIACYALARPPGHHASQDIAGGFCYLNNSAIAAQQLLEKFKRVAIIDVDVHHGNGTQQIFWRRADVLYASLHADPRRLYPFFLGHADEVGEGAGAGANLNLPQPLRADDEIYLADLEQALEWIDASAGSIVVVSLGFDTYERDPIGDLALTTAGYHEMGLRVGALGRRLVILQEGGYFVPDLGANAVAWLRGAAGMPLGA